MKRVMLLFLICCGGAALFAEERSVADTPEAFAAWKGAKQGTFLPQGGPEKKSAIRLASTDASRSALCELPLDLKEFAGKLICFSADIRLDGVKKPEKPYYGLKLMIVYTRSDGSRHWAEDLKPSERYGSRDWEPYEAITKVPADARDVMLSFGLQQAVGAAEFAGLKLEIIE